MVPEGTDRDPRDHRGGQQPDEDEHDQRPVQRRDEQAQVADHREAVLADRGTDRGRDADRSVLHHDVGELEHDLRKTLAEGEHRLPGRPFTWASATAKSSEKNTT